MINWFNTKEEQEFGISLANFFCEKFPLELGRKKNKSLAQRQKVLENMFRQIAEFKKLYKLNMYKKAKLGNSFKWHLIEAGYDHEFVDEMTKIVLLKL